MSIVSLILLGKPVHLPKGKARCHFADGKKPQKDNPKPRAKSSANLRVSNDERKAEREKKKGEILKFVATQQEEIGVSIYPIAEQFCINDELARVFIMELFNEDLLYVSYSSGRGGKRFFKATPKGLNATGIKQANGLPSKLTLAQQLGITCKNNEE